MVSPKQISLIVITIYFLKSPNGQSAEVSLACDISELSQVEGITPASTRRQNSVTIVVWLNE